MHRFGVQRRPARRAMLHRRRWRRLPVWRLLQAASVRAQGWRCGADLAAVCSLIVPDSTQGTRCRSGRGGGSPRLRSAAVPDCGGRAGRLAYRTEVSKPRPDAARSINAHTLILLGPSPWRAPQQPGSCWPAWPALHSAVSVGAGRGVLGEPADRTRTTWTTDGSALSLSQGRRLPHHPRSPRSPACPPAGALADASADL